MTDNLLIVWNGAHRIKGIIAVRTVFGLDLKQAINLLKSDGGFVVSPLQWIALRGEYMINRAMQTDLSVNDWIVEPYAPLTPVWLVDHVCYDRSMS